MRADSDASASGDFLVSLRVRAAARPRRVVFPEGTEPRVQEAVGVLSRDRLVVPVVLGPSDAVRSGLQAHGVDGGDVEVVDSADERLIEATMDHLVERRSGRGDRKDALRRMASDPLMQAGYLVATGSVDGAVAGCVRTTADVVRAALTCVGLADGIRTLSSAFYMAFEAGHPVGPRVITFTDAGVVPDPDADRLVDIAAGAVLARGRLVGDDARVAFLSYSTYGSAQGPSVARVKEALARFRERLPDVPADGELQADAALDSGVAARKAPGSPLEGAANVLVFPDLAAANISYKLVQYLGGAVALGPVLQGLARPFNDLSRGAVAEDIIAVACITALLAD
jgi:phosphate acetyltransferase